MRKILATIGVLIAIGVVLSIVWLSAGRRISVEVDRFGTITASSVPINSVIYKGLGNGGTLRLNDREYDLTLAEPKTEPPHVGTTKDGEVALSFGGKVFAFGPVGQTTGDGDEKLTTSPPAGDSALLRTKRSAIDWVEPFQFNFMTGQSPSWKRHLYYQVTWQKPTGARLEMIWRYEQFFDRGTGWTDAAMTREGATGLIQIVITP
jgi:hypothetical protein